MMITITWLLLETFTIITLDMGSAPHAEYSDVVPYGASADINNCPMDGLASISNSTSLLRNLNYKQTLQMSTIWSGFHAIVLMLGDIVYTWMAYLLVNVLN